MGASTVKIATYYEQVVRKKKGCRSNKSIKKRSYVGVGDIRGELKKSMFVSVSTKIFKNIKRGASWGYVS